MEGCTMSIIGDRISKYASSHASKLAISTTEEEVTYKELQLHIDQMQQILLSLIPDIKGKKIAFLLNHSVSWLEVFLSISGVGGIAIPLDSKWKGNQMKQVLADCNPDMVVSNDSFLGKYPILETYSYQPVSRFYQLPKRFSQKKEVGEDDLFYIGYTSGTTGTPKGFMRTHGSWADCFSEGMKRFGLTQDDKIFCPGPLVHSHFLYASLQALHIGATLYVSNYFDAEDVLDRIDREEITVLYVVPTMFEAMHKMTQQYTLTSLKTLISSGAMWGKESKQKAIDLLPNVQIYEFYGASELSFVSVKDVRDELHSEGSIGVPFQQVELSIRTENGGEAPSEEVGELYVKSPWIFSGYLNKPERTDEVFAGEWATVGDLGYRDGSGNIILIGRKHNMVISGGLNIYPEEVEHVIRNHPHVEDVIVLGVEDVYWGEKVVAIYIPSQSDQLDVDELKAHCKTELPSYKCPKNWIQSSHFYYTSSGKVSRDKMKQWIQLAVR
ncbi:AMP-binding protein [Pontibacillus yanchengensis]|uniref:AMP-binding protein n=2 Tax=Pontibacillus yanchengensis TaxID=462910 RepID=A0A6I5A114_9BACI|nr:AMP-binding protein [Pontibacillus yanchengensis]